MKTVMICRYNIGHWNSTWHLCCSECGFSNRICSVQTVSGLFLLPNNYVLILGGFLGCDSNFEVNKKKTLLQMKRLPCINNMNLESS